jgi:RNA polymerase sigma-70 factor (ECF subfamily)
MEFFFVFFPKRCNPLPVTNTYLLTGMRMFEVDIFAPAAHDRCVAEAFQKNQQNQQDQRDIDAVLSGDGEAYARIVARHQEMIAGRMWRFTRDKRQLEELVADVFVEAYTSLANYRGEGEFSHWLSVIATRVGYRFWKRRDRLRIETPLENWDGPVPPSDDPLEAAEAGETLHALLDKLPARDRLVLTLMYWEGKSVTQVSAETGWSESMVKVQAHRARKKLKRRLE